MTTSPLSERGVLYVGAQGLSPALRAYVRRPNHNKTVSEQSFWYHDKESWAKASEPIFRYEERVNARNITPRAGYTDDELEEVFEMEIDETAKCHAYWRTPLKGLSMQTGPLVRTLGEEKVRDLAFDTGRELLDALVAKTGGGDGSLLMDYEDIPLPLGRASGWPTCAPGSAIDEAFRMWRPALVNGWGAHRTVEWARRDAGGVASGVIGSDPFLLRVFRLQEAKESRAGSDRTLSITAPPALTDPLSLPVAMISESLSTGAFPGQAMTTLGSVLPEGYRRSLERLVRGDGLALLNTERVSPAWALPTLTETVVPGAPRQRDAYVESKPVNSCQIGLPRWLMAQFKWFRNRDLLLSEGRDDNLYFAEHIDPLVRDRYQGFAVTPSNLDDASATLLSLHEQPSLGPDGLPDGSGEIEWADEDTKQWDLNVPWELSSGGWDALVEWARANLVGSGTVPRHELENLDEMREFMFQSPLVTPAPGYDGALLCAHWGPIPSGAFLTTAFGTFLNFIKMIIKFWIVRKRLWAQGRRPWSPTIRNCVRVMVQRGRGIILATDDAMIGLTAEEWAIWRTLDVFGFTTTRGKAKSFLRNGFLLRKRPPRRSEGIRHPGGRRVVRYPVLGRQLLAIINDEPGRSADRETAKRLGLLVRGMTLEQGHPWPIEYQRTVLEMEKAGPLYAEAVRKGFAVCALEEAQAVIKASSVPDEYIARLVDPDMPQNILGMLPEEWTQLLREVYYNRVKMSVAQVRVLAAGENRTLEQLAAARIAMEERRL